MQLAEANIKINHQKHFIVSLLMMSFAISVVVTTFVAVDFIHYSNDITLSRTIIQRGFYVIMALSKSEFDNIQVLLILTLYSRFKLINDCLRYILHFRIIYCLILNLISEVTLQNLKRPSKTYQSRMTRFAILLSSTTLYFPFQFLLMYVM